MLKFCIVAIVAWIVGVIGWAQIIGSLQNVDKSKGLLGTLIVWIVIMGVGAYFAISKFDASLPLIIGYAVAFIQIKAQGRIQ